MGAVRPFEVEENYRRYIIQSTERIPFWLTLSQAASWVMGVRFAIYALGMWALAGNRPTAERIGVNMGAAILLAGVFLPLLSSSGRGALVKVQIDTARGEVREVLRNRAGRMTILWVHGFDSIGGGFWRSVRRGTTGRCSLSCGFGIRRRCCGSRASRRPHFARSAGPAGPRSDG